MQGAADILRQSKKVIGIGSPRASVESNFALRELVGEENFYTGIAHGEQERLQLALKVLREGGIYTPALREIESYDAVLVLGEDVTQTGARVALAVRQAVKGKAREMAAAQKVADWQIAAILNIGQRAKHPLFVTNVDDTRLDDIAAWTYRAPVEDQARLGFAIAHALDNSAPAVDGIEPELQSKIDVIVQALAGAKKPLIISGTNAGSAEVIQAAANVAKALKGRGADVGITMIARSVNSMGLGIMGGGSLEEALTELETGRADAVVVLECSYMNNELSKVRKESVQIAVNTHSGIMVNKKAIHVEPVMKVIDDGSGRQVKQEVMVQGVYVLYGSELVFKEIVPLSTYSTFVLCDPNPEEDATFNGETIKLYDEVVVGGTDLYDGKIV